MFVELTRAKFSDKYQLTWLDLPSAEFNTKVAVWLKQLGKIIGGPSKKDRKALASEFLQLLYVYKQMLDKLSGLSRSPESAQMLSKMTDFCAAYKKEFGSSLDLPNVKMSNDLVKITEDMGKNAAKRDLIVMKKQVIKYWLKGLREDQPHLDDVSLTLQYLGNADPAKVRLFLDVLVRDLHKLTVGDPRPWIKAEGKVEKGFMTGGEDGRISQVTWTNDHFKKAVKAEVSVAYGVRASGECSIDLSGLKAKFKADAFAGTKLEAEAEASWGLGRGGQLKASVDAMIGVRIKAEAEIDVADVFLLEASAEAFAGALARGEVELTGTVDGVTLKLEAEVFAGAKVEGKAALTLRMCGYDIIKGEAKGSLSVGVGASFKLEFESSVFGGTKLGIEAGATVGVGGSGGGEFTVYADNLGRVANSIYFSAYLTLMGRSKERDTWRTYFRDLEDNEIMLKKADEIVDQSLIACFMEHQQIFSRQVAWKQLEVLSAFKTNTRIPDIIGA